MAKKRLEDNLSEEEDPSGNRGISRAEEILRRKGYPSAMPKSIKEIIPLSPKDIRAAPNVNSLIKEDLNHLKKEGYNVDMKYFQNQDNTGKWNYYLKVLVDNGYFK